MLILLDPSGHFTLLVSFLSLCFYSITLPRFSPISLVTLPSHLHVLLLSDLKYWAERKNNEENNEQREEEEEYERKPPGTEMANERH